MDLFKKGAITGIITGTIITGVEIIVIECIIARQEIKKTRKLKDILEKANKEQIRLLGDYYSLIHECRYYLLDEKETDLRATLTQYLLNLTEAQAKCNLKLSCLGEETYDNYCREKRTIGLSQTLNQFKCECDLAIYDFESEITTVMECLDRYKEKYR